MTHTVRALDEYAAEWRRLPRATPREQAAAEAYYNEQVLPLLRLDFAAREHTRLPRRYTGLIVAVGPDPTPAILSLAAVRPERAHFVYEAGRVGAKQAASQPSAGEQDLSRILAPYVTGITPYDRTQLDEPAILQAYAAVRSVYADWGAPDAVLVDITGASPQASAGLAMAAYIVGADLVAVEATEHWPDVGRPRPGSEHLAFPPQPYAIFGDLADAEARAAWARHDFSLARDLFDRLAEAVDPAHYRPYRDLAAAYDAWQAFDAALAPNLARALAALERAPAHPLARHLARLRAQADVAQRLAPLLAAAEEPADLDLLRQLDRVAGLAFSLRRSAREQAGNGRYDLAVLLQYRLLELLMQRRLALRGLSTVAPDYSALALPDPAAALAARRRELLGEEQEAVLPRTVGLGAGLVLLDLVGDPLAAAVDWPLLQSCLPARSRSILVHGFRSLGPESDLAFRRLLEPILAAFCRAEGLNCEEMERTFEFVPETPACSA